MSKVLKLRNPGRDVLILFNNSFPRLIMSSERLIKSSERLIMSSERLIKSSERVIMSSERLIKYIVHVTRMVSEVGYTSFRSTRGHVN